MHASARPHHSSIVPDMVILGLFVLAAVAGGLSIVFKSGNGLAFTQLALTLGGLLLGVVQVKPELLGTGLGKILKTIGGVVRGLMVVLLAVIIVLQAVNLSEDRASASSKTPPPLANSTPTLAPAPSPTLTPTPSLPSVLILDPMDGSQVNMITIVRGSIQGVPKDEELWLFIVPSNQASFFPQPGPIQILGGNWTIAAHVGVAGDVGLKFTLIPVLVRQDDQKSHDVLKGYFQQPGPEYKGIQPTSGMQLLSPDITVVRG